MDADKNLGDVLVSRLWLKNEGLRLLREAARVTTMDDFLHESAVWKCRFESFILQSFYSGTICKQKAEFLLQDLGTNKAGTFRIRVKLHKTPVVGRPILNLGKSWLAPAAAFLVETLKPAASTLAHVVQSSVEVLDLLSETFVDESICLATFDISNLYPSVDRAHFIACVARRIRSFWSGKAAFANFLIKLVEFVLGCQFIRHNDSLWRVDRGLPTGLSASVVFANLYLADLDDFVQRECNFVLIWRRYIDDALAFLKLQSTDCVSIVRQVLNRWHPAIQWEVSFSGKRVVFLDLDISLIDGHFAVQTYRKPQNAYLYIPVTSCHPKSVYTALIVGETQRLFRQNHQDEGRLRHHIGFFMSKLQRRGFTVSDSSKTVATALQKLRHGNRKVKKDDKFFFKQTYSSTLNTRWIQRSLRRNWHVVQSTLKKQSKPVLSFRVQKNIFRMDFCRNWLPSLIPH